MKNDVTFCNQLENYVKISYWRISASGDTSPNNSNFEQIDLELVQTSITTYHYIVPFSISWHIDIILTPWFHFSKGPA